MYSKNSSISEREKNHFFLKLEKIQKKLASRIKIQPLGFIPRFIAGIDVSYSGDNYGYAVIVVMEWKTFKIVEIKSVKSKVLFPYVPGFLSFREIPLILKCFFKLNLKPELIFVDGQGIAHPRKMGLATHLGVLLNIPTLGCAKKPLIKCKMPENKKGAIYPIFLEKEVVGYALRTKQGVKPVFVSPGHLISLEESVEFTLQAVTKYRIPEPLRIAHQLSLKAKNFVKNGCFLRYM